MNVGRKAIVTELKKIIVGQDEVISQVLNTLFVGGNSLIVGAPGLAKTLLIHTMAQVLQLKFSRIQFTPDLMPSDITGTDLVQEDAATGRRQMVFAPGPIFANIILADEINRTPPKTQSALLEAMQEHAVTAAGKRYELSEPFWVLATQNPIEQEGTYPLPEAQMDRFLLKIRVGYPTPEEEARILDRMGGEPPEPPRPVIDAKTILEARHSVNAIYLDERIRNYIVDLVHATREPERCGLDVRPLGQYGASPRATLARARGARALAF